VEPRKVSDEEIVHRLVYALVNEGARILEEGIALRASDIDMVYLTGYGFPLWRGGPMCYADTVGLWNVVQAMKRFARNPRDDAQFWQPAPLLARLAAEAAASADGCRARHPATADEADARLSPCKRRACCRGRRAGHRVRGTRAAWSRAAPSTRRAAPAAKGEPAPDARGAPPRAPPPPEGLRPTSTNAPRIDPFPQEIP
jgi:hypothetical protein